MPGNRRPRDETPVEQAARIAALGLGSRLPAGAVTELRADLRDAPDPRVRSAALGALVRVTAASTGRTACSVASRDGSSAVRRRAAELATGVADLRLARRLVAMLGDSDVTVLEAAAWALGELGDTAVAAGAVPVLAQTATGHHDAIAREAAVAALGALGDPAGLQAVLDACSDKATVRRRAVLALAAFTGPGVDAAIAIAVDDRDWQVRQAAEDLRAAGGD
ncbi:MAG TPA: HEAT repeat domain-containing protein [Acidimicrobiia bacterium]|nr:HEAT repeat domain-containing protein [Acidimicrobiia bacterium]